MSDVAARVKKIVVEHLGVDEDKVADSASFIDDLGADSLDTVELVMAFEEEFGIEIPDDAAETIQTFGDAVNFISENTCSRVDFGRAAPSGAVFRSGGILRAGPCALRVPGAGGKQAQKKAEARACGE